MNNGDQEAYEKKVHRSVLKIRIVVLRMYKRYSSGVQSPRWSNARNVILSSEVFESYLDIMSLLVLLVLKVRDWIFGIKQSETWFSFYSLLIL